LPNIKNLLTDIINLINYELFINFFEKIINKDFTNNNKELFKQIFNIDSINKQIHSKIDSSNIKDPNNIKDVISLIIGKFLEKEDTTVNINEKNEIIDVNTKKNMNILIKQLKSIDNKNIDILEFILKIINESIDQIFKNEFNEFLKIHHCPLRWQGNFINESIKKIKLIGDSINTSKINTPTISDKSDDIITKFNDLLKIDNTTINNKNIVLINCIRVDKDDGLERTLDFAHCMNPLRNQKLSGNKRCESNDNSNKNSNDKYNNKILNYKKYLI
jgi:hypothetical protein